MSPGGHSTSSSSLNCINTCSNSQGWIETRAAWIQAGKRYSIILDPNIGCGWKIEIGRWYYTTTPVHFFVLEYIVGTKNASCFPPGKVPGPTLDQGWPLTFNCSVGQVTFLRKSESISRRKAIMITIMEYNDALLLLPPVLTVHTSFHTCLLYRTFRNYSSSVCSTTP